ncbi:MAG TPA: hypothetical protein PLE23_12975, partial [Saprospiraceae bacterium]|nr:hypothetical protein [Saprospiraceae bacterium]
DAKIPLVYVNRKPANLPEGVAYVGSDSIDAGHFQMEYIAKKLDFSLEEFEELLALPNRDHAEFGDEQKTEAVINSVRRIFRPIKRILK